MSDNQGVPIFEDAQEYILSVTKMLNEATLTPEPVGNMYIKVELVDDTGTRFGEWSDEISSDCWSYAPYNVPIRPEGK